MMNRNNKKKSTKYYFEIKIHTHTHTNYFCTLQIIIKNICMMAINGTHNSSISTIATIYIYKYISAHLGENFLHIYFYFKITIINIYI